ncbi:uncharacterized protein AAGF69_008525 isoform 2-T2 [Amazona ochrocephala]
MPSIFSLRTRNSIIRRLPLGRRVCRWRARAACLRGGLWELHLCVATNELGNSNASIILYALLLRLSACDRPERGQGKSRQDCWDAFHLLPAYQKLYHPTVTHGPKGVQMEGKGRLPQRRAMGTTPVCGHERAGQQQCQHHPVWKKNDWRRRVKNKEEAASPESSAEEASQEQGKEKRQSPGGAETAPPRAESQKGEVEVLGEHHTEGMRLGFWCLRSSAPAPGLQSFF